MHTDLRRACPVCGALTHDSVLAEAGWIDDATESRLRVNQPFWTRPDGACPACVQQALLAELLKRGEPILGRLVQEVWPLDADAAFGALPTPLRMRADPRFTGVGVTVAVIDAAFHCHDDLVRPVNRIRAWVDATSDAVVEHRYGPGDAPRWPGSDLATAWHWHGLMTSATLAGNGWHSHGLYRGLASDASLVLIAVGGSDARIGSARLRRALEWIVANHEELAIRVVNVSLGVGADTPGDAAIIDVLVDQLTAVGVSVVAAAGNDGERSLAIPAMSPAAITVGGLDDRNVLDRAESMLWHSNYDGAAEGFSKPELVAPSLWVVAPIIPTSDLAREAVLLFARRASSDIRVEPRLRGARLVTPYYQHVEGTSFASPIVSGVIACMLEACPSLPASLIRLLLQSACQPVAGASIARQGAGAIDAGRAVMAALAFMRGEWKPPVHSPDVSGGAMIVRYRDAHARSVQIRGSWNGWAEPGVHAAHDADGTWVATLDAIAPGRYAYKLLVDGTRWLADPVNPLRDRDGLGGWNSIVTTVPPLN